MLALPGTLCAPSIFAPVAQRLRGQVTVDARPWLTESAPWDIPAIAARQVEHLTRSHSDPVLLCGHSTGGAIALQLALTRPDLVAGLVLVDTGAHMRGHGDVDAILRRVRGEWGEALHAALLDRSFHQPPDPDVRAELLRWAAQVDPRAAHDVLASQRDLDLSDRLTELTMPTIVVHGIHDLARSVADAEALTAAIPGASLRLLETGHTPPYEAPDEFAAIIRGLADECAR